MDIEYGLLDIVVRNGAKYVTLIPPPPSEAERWLGLALAIAKWGYAVQVLNLPTCRAATLAKALARARGAPVYLKYSYALAYAGHGVVLDPEEPSAENIRKEAQANRRYVLDWRRCLALERKEGRADKLGPLPEALDSLRAWLAERLG